MIGLRELAMVATVVLVLYGRTGVIRSRRFQAIWPWIAPVKRKPGRPAVDARTRPDGTGTPDGPPTTAPAFRLEGNRLFWFLTILAATAVATTIVTRAMILQAGSPAPHP